ncbi:hypothetical protein DLAC_03333 [Tieghemostelium lacteum]|uniref:Uncharacterized protein n=1 Tax=Tieghemostelium lacteum TaxID=361077 RepID=A0A152A1Q8_TIELA|nr:hypothetical protein DLAC_03333 [Tieghemostelium lacteum]|eukprot:KYR00178.1 hypothetical protein DLAC_03333 [Tieghemostelium lacteum]
MSPTSLPIPDFQDGPQNILRDEILGIIEKIKIAYDKSIVGVVSHVPIYFNFGSITNYGASERATVLRAVKTNVAAIIKQFEVSFDKMDNLNKSNVNNYLLRVVVNNTPGKASTSKKCMFYPDGTVEITTVFEDGLNCQYYLEKKIMACLNEFRPAAGSQVSQKVESFVPVATPTTPPPETVVQTPQTPSASNIDLSVPYYPNPQWENFKTEAIAACKPLRFEAVLPGPPFDVPVNIDWQSVPLSGADFSVVLKSMKTNIPSILKQVIPGIQKVDEFRKAIIRDFLVSIVFQNIAGKASTSKRCFLSAEGSLMIIVPFEDNLNCSYYFEKKITSGLNEFQPPQGVSAPPKINVVPVQPVQPVVQQPVVQQPPQQVFAPQYGTGSLPTAQPQQPQPVYVQPVVQHQPVYVQPVVQQPVYQQPPQPQYQPQYTSYVQPKPVEVVKPVEVPKVREPPKEKGRPEMEERPNVEDPAGVFLVREIDYIISQMKVLDEKDQYFGVPLYLDWKSIMVYPSAVKQSTVLRNVNLVLYRLLRDVLNAIKLSCTDYINKDNIVEYLRSVTIQHMQGSSPSLKKVVYEDGHLTVQTTFEDFGNCALYFDSKVIQAFQSKPSQPAPKKPEPLQLVKEELPIRLMAHQALKNPKTGCVYTPTCPVEMDWSFLTVKGNESLGVEHNLIASTNPLLTDFFLAMLSFDQKDVDILCKEITKITFCQAPPGKTIFDKRGVVMNDAGNLIITTTFEDKMEGVKTFKEKYICIMKSRLSKVIIRDTLVPEIKKMIDTAVKVNYKPNYLDNIPVNEFQSYSSVVQFDWQLVDKEPVEQQVKFYSDIVINMQQNKTFTTLLDKSIRDICSYDVGKNAFLPCKTFILRNIIKFKEEQLKFVGGTTWEFYVSFHDPAHYQINKNSLTKDFKEKLVVAFPCAIQDTFPVIDEYVEELQSATGKKVPIVMKYDSWRKFQRFAEDPFSYLTINQIACKTIFKGLDCISSLTKDIIVKKEYTSKVNTIEITYDTANKVKGAREKDPNAIATLNNGVLAFTLNFEDGPRDRMQSWDYQLEYVLGTRQLKIQRSIQNAKQDLERTSKNLSNLIGKPVTIDVDYTTFINNFKFLYALEEPTYTKVIQSFYSLVEAGWLNSQESAELLSYETLKKSIQTQLNKVTFKVNCDSAQRENYEFQLSSGELTVGLNLNSACTVATMPWRLEVERLFKLRDLRIQEEIAKRVDFNSSKTQILSTLAKQSVTITIDWQSIITNPDFSRNLTDYYVYLHKFAEGITRELAKTSGFGKLCEYPEVLTLVQAAINAIRIQASTSDGMVVDYESGSKTIVCKVGIRNLFKYLQSSADNYEEYGRQIENIIGCRIPCIRAFIKRREPEVVSAVKSRLREAVELDVGFTFDWNSIIEHPSFNRLQDPVPTLKNILLLGPELHPLVQLCRENFKAKEELKTVRNYTIFIDGNSRVNESEFSENKFGVDWAKVGWKTLPAKDHILITVNLDRLTKDKPHNLELELKVEFLVTPDKALDRYQTKMDEIHRQEEADANDRFRRDQRRMDQQMLDASRENNRQLESLNRKFRR